jgi:cytidylate kinase
MHTKLSEGISGFMHLIEKQIRLHEVLEKTTWKDETKAFPFPFRFITISRDLGSWGSLIASELADELNWKIYDKEVVDHIASHNHVLQSKVNQLDEKTQNRVYENIERLFTAFQPTGFSNDVYHVSLIQALSDVAGQGKCIILGHGGAYALQESNGLHIRITAPFPVRVRRLSQRLGIPLGEARGIVQRTDKERADFIKRHFGIDAGRDVFFHTVFNTDKCSIDHIIAAILAVMGRSVRRMVTRPAQPSSHTPPRVA